MFATIGGKVRSYATDPLYHNSLFVWSSSIINNLAGFLFWYIAARSYSIIDIGIAVGIINAVSFLMALSRMGFDEFLIRFLPSNDRSKIFNTTLIITLLSAMFFFVSYLIVSELFLSSMPVIYYVFMLIIVLSNTFVMTTCYSFLATRRGLYYFIINMLLSSRVLLLFLLAFIGGMGIILSFSATYAIVSIIAILLLFNVISFKPEIDLGFARKNYVFSFSNYAKNIIYVAPIYLLPILVLNMINPAEAAKFYIALSIYNIIMAIPGAISNSFYVEISHGKSLRESLLKSLIIVYLIILPIIAGILLFGDIVLGAFGSEYVEAYGLLKVLSLATIFVAFFSFFSPIQNLKMNNLRNVWVNLMLAVVLIGLNLLFIPAFGIIGSGYAWIIAYSFISAVMLTIAIIERWI